MESAVVIIFNGHGQPAIWLARQLRIRSDFYKDNKECSVKNAVEDRGKYQVVLSVLSDIKKDFKMVMSFKHLNEIIKAFDNQAAITIKYNIS